jgi:very-short-patch-repair endonuclease
LVIELDGGIHAGQVDYDTSRTEWLQDQGYHVIRFQNEDIIQHLPDVMLRIIKTCEQLCVQAEEMIDGHIRKEL